MLSCAAPIPPGEKDHLPPGPMPQLVQIEPSTNPNEYCCREGPRGVCYRNVRGEPSVWRQSAGRGVASAQVDRLPVPGTRRKPVIITAARWSSPPVAEAHEGIFRMVCQTGAASALAGSEGGRWNVSLLLPSLQMPTTGS